MKKKKDYRIQNWPEYNQSLVNRGNLTLWIDEETIKLWLNTAKNGKKGRDRIYNDIAIQCLLTLKAIFKLPLRAAEGFGNSLMKMMKLDLPIPDYTTLCRRQSTLSVTLPRSGNSEPMHMVIDSTGLKIYGEGEWKVRQHGYSKRRTWRKIHLAVDGGNQEIVAALLTENDTSDGEALPILLEQVDEKIGCVIGDGAYDRRDCYAAIGAKGARAVIPPRSGARVSGGVEGLSDRDAAIGEVKKDGMKSWKKRTGYHVRSLAETCMFRLKTIFGRGLRSRIFENQVVEALLRCLALNRMTLLGMPDSYAVVSGG